LPNAQARQWCIIVIFPSYFPVTNKGNLPHGLQN